MFRAEASVVRVIIRAEDLIMKRKKERTNAQNLKHDRQKINCMLRLCTGSAAAETDSVYSYRINYFGY